VTAVPVALCRLKVATVSGCGVGTGEAGEGVGLGVGEVEGVGVGEAAPEALASAEVLGEGVGLAVPGLLEATGLLEAAVPGLELAALPLGVALGVGAAEVLSMGVVTLPNVERVPIGLTVGAGGVAAGVHATAKASKRLEPTKRTAGDRKLLMGVGSSLGGTHGGPQAFVPSYGFMYRESLRFQQAGWGYGE
jgi:hypothetical protein